MLIHILGLVGVFAFAFLGARDAKLHGFNVACMLLFAFLTALGGGTIRSIILDQSPVYFDTYDYVITIGIGTGAAILAHNLFALIRPLVLFMDAIGTIIVAYFGAAAAVAAHLGPLACMSMAALTAYGGSILCDLLARTTPRIFNKPTLYVFPAILTGLTCWLVSDARIGQGIASILIATAFLAQMAIAYSYSQTMRSRIIPLLHQHFIASLFQGLCLVVMPQIRTSQNRNYAIVESFGIR